MTPTAKQQRFVDEYLVDLNATQAAIRAGYSANNADVTGPRLLGNVGIAKAITQGKAAMAKRAQIGQDAVVERLAALAFADLRDVAEWGPGRFRLKDSAALPSEAAASVREISVQANTGATSPTLRMTIKQHDQIQALRLLGQHLGMFKDRVEIDVRAGGLDGLLDRLRLAVHGEKLERALEAGDLAAARRALKDAKQ
jgi:phage terminase small subunit